MLGFQRAWRGAAREERTLVLINYDSAARTASLGQLPAGGRLISAYPANDASLNADARGGAEVNLPAQSVRVFRIEPR